MNESSVKRNSYLVYTEPETGPKHDRATEGVLYGPHEMITEYADKVNLFLAARDQVKEFMHKETKEPTRLIRQHDIERMETIAFLQCLILDAYRDLELGSQLVDAVEEMVSRMDLYVMTSQLKA